MIINGKQYVSFYPDSTLLYLKKRMYLLHLVENNGSDAWEQAYRFVIGSIKKDCEKLNDHYQWKNYK